MSKWIWLVVVLAAVLLILFFNQTGVQGSSAVQVPDAINKLVAVFLATVLTLGTEWLFRTLGLDLRQFAAPIALAIGAFVAGELQHIVNVIPMMYDPWIQLFFQGLLIVLAPIGTILLFSGGARNLLAER